MEERWKQKDDDILALEIHNSWGRLRRRDGRIPADEAAQAGHGKPPPNGRVQLSELWQTKCQK